MAKKSIIRLFEIPPEGQSYTWDRKSGELGTQLDDLIENEAYQVDFTIRPINHRDFSLTGRIQAQSPEACSMCGIDFKLRIQQTFSEILIPYQPQSRNSQYARVNHVSDAGDQESQSFEYPPSGELDMGEYIHETIGLALPSNPKPEANQDGDCQVCGLNFEKHNFGFDEPMEVKKPENPFAVLKGIKLQ